MALSRAVAEQQTNRQRKVPGQRDIYVRWSYMRFTKYIVSFVSEKANVRALRSAPMINLAIFYVFLLHVTVSAVSQSRIETESNGNPVSMSGL